MDASSESPFAVPVRLSLRTAPGMLFVASADGLGEGIRTCHGVLLRGAAVCLGEETAGQRPAQGSGSDEHGKRAALASCPGRVPSGSSRGGMSHSAAMRSPTMVCSNPAPVARVAAGAAGAVSTGFTPSLDSRSCCSVVSCPQVPGCFCRCSRRPMSSPSISTPGAMPGRTPPGSSAARSVRRRWWRCQSSGHGQFQSGAMASSRFARSAARSGSLPRPPLRRRSAMCCPMGTGLPPAGPSQTASWWPVSPAD
jgi:hypothetical protein